MTPLAEPETPEVTGGMDSFVSEMGTYLSSDNLWGAVASVAPILGVILVFTVGFTIVRRVLKGGAKGKLSV